MDARTNVAMLTGAFLVFGALFWWSWAERQAARRALAAQAELVQITVTELLARDGDCGIEASTERLVRVGLGLVARDGVSFALLVEGDLAYQGDDSEALEIVRRLLAYALSHARRVSSCAQIIVGHDLLQIVVPHARRIEPLGGVVVRESAARVGWQVRREWSGHALHFVVEPAPRIACLQDQSSR